MKFTAKHDLEAPVEGVFARCSDFAAIEKAALERGVEVTRRSVLTQPGAQLGWDVRVKLRGRARNLQVELVGCDAPDSVIYVIEGAGVRSEVVTEFVSLARNRTRIHVAIDIRPKTMGGRLLIQSLKLAKGSLNRKLKKRLADFGLRLEEEVEQV
ncbi:SRPBCC family protein [Thalassobius sp. I31.1]|uniref:SRPBCC family protein n=1 Tax=Thalassobius sp. I31.1 TaxID=2109912 RepID=UPI000D1AB3D2|nr:SRPBCC family protein [Thalassobius sp. I31.1]